MTTTTKPRKSTTPRKAARAPRAVDPRRPTAPGPDLDALRANGQTASAPEPDVRPPELFEPTTTPEVAPETPAAAIAGGTILDHPYGDKQVYVFQPHQVKPGDSMDPIILPHISTMEADVEFFWELDEMDPMHQSFRYMRRCGVPRDIQRRVVRLPDEEMGRLFRNWFMGIITPQGVGPPPES